MADTLGVRFSNEGPLALIAGPCVMEDEDETLETARRLREIASELGMDLVFKASFDKANRQSLSSFRGPGLEKGLEILSKVKDETGLPVLTDIHLPSQAAPAAGVADILQIPAFLSRQTDLVVEAARTARTVSIKKGQFLAPGQMNSIAEKAERSGSPRVILIERGTFFGYGDLVVDMRSLESLKAGGRPVFFDATHAVQRPGGKGGASSGEREFVPALVRAAAGVGIAGLYLEVHPEPSRAKSDPDTQWPLSRLKEILSQAKRIDEVVKV